ncbi:ATP synthase gamma chain [Companilactobacillus sp. RD055328]|uniref:F0F1 ATP synthase subunit gamma n=1 Tax=Companilactobacillus sp. RD055328 TaxID=2916634 RepID=UPI001FC8992D|nr:F0F1 ATP synthase subunit gamma [Companilactobacillus sp. RD055328]GKQ42882.1 ATP synthase gamma chain [Companilactobacillus sp. RD055328]
MAESLIDIKRRIASTKKTSQITNAMQMVSGSKLMKIEKQSITYQMYAEKLKSVVSHLASSKLLEEVRTSAAAEVTNQNSLLSLNNLLVERPVQKTAYMVITSDRGLVGGFNSNILKAMMNIIKEKHNNNKDEFVIVAIGATGAEFFKNRGYNVAYEYRGISDVPTIDDVKPIVNTLIQLYISGVYDELFICHNHHVNSLTSEFISDQLLPITNHVNNDNEVAEEYIADPSPVEVLQQILPQFVDSLVFGSMLDSKTAEHAASMTAMKSSTDNANNLISTLTTKFNRARQAQITTEITEIVGGAAALE